MNIIKNTLLCLAMIVLAGFLSCSTEPALSNVSNLDTTSPARNALDKWIIENFTKPYNIEVLYRWTESLVDQSRHLYPPTLDSVKPALNLVKKLWIEPYSAADPHLVSKIAPRQLVLVGGVNMNPTRTVVLGMAEAGKRITLFEIDLCDKSRRSDILEFIHTIQHEYVHILNQTKPFNEEVFERITPSGYTGQWFNEKLKRSNALGFVTIYARANVREDFAEMVSSMLELSRAEWNEFLNNIPEEGRRKIAAKEQLVTEYYKSEFGIDLYQLQENVNKAILKF